MSTYKEMVYMILDELKLTSDDALITQEHIIYLINNYRAFILKQRYSDIKKFIPESNYQTICIELIEVPPIDGDPCECGAYLRSKLKIPYAMQIGVPRVYPFDYYQGEISYINRDRMRYVGYNHYLQNVIYCSLAPDSYLYFKSYNPQFLHLKQVKFSAIFQNPKDVFDLLCTDADGIKLCDLLDSEFPLEEALIPVVRELIVNELSKSQYKPEDKENNADDDLADVSTKR